MAWTPVATAALSIQVAGNHLVDGAGHEVVLHGVNRSGTEYACVQGWGIFDGPNDQASISAIASWHANAVRVPLNEDCWLGINGVPAQYGGTSYQKAISDYVSLLTANGLYTILDLHWSAPGTTAATGQNPMPDADHSPAFWSGVATAFKSNRAVLFDLHNEPYPDSNQDTAAAWTCWRDGGTCPGAGYSAAGMQSLVTAVRSTGAQNVIMLGGVEYANALSGWLSHRPSDPAAQLAASFHDYEFNTCADAGCWNTVIAPLAAQVPVITGEIGEDDGGASFINTYMAWADAHGIGYLAWVWDTWGCGAGQIALISDYAGTPCPQYGMSYRSHLAALVSTTPLTLGRYVSSGRHWVTTGAVDGGWVGGSPGIEEAPLGALAPASFGGAAPLYGCVSGAVHFLSRDSGCEGQTLLRTEGYSATAAAGTYSLAIYRCRVAASNDHFVSTDPHCEGQTSEGGLGFVARHVQLQRSYSGSAADHWSVAGSTGPGYGVELGLGWLAVDAEPGTRPLYGCTVGADRFTSFSATCEGQRFIGRLGYIWTELPAGGGGPVYRCLSGADHFDSPGSACEGRHEEAQLGWTAAA
jgi:hypothetical protein